MTKLKLSRQARHQARRRAVGLCSCGRKPRTGRTKCEKCAAAANRNAAAIMRAYRERKKMRDKQHEKSVKIQK